MQGRFEELIALLNKAIELNPDYPEGYNNLGIALQKHGDLAAAIISFNKAINLKPNYPEAYNNLGIALQEQGEVTDAIRTFNKTLALKPDYPEAHYNLGNALKKQENLVSAIESYNAALKIKPNYPDAHNNLGVVLQMNGDLDAAGIAYNNALTYEPEHADANNSLSFYLLQTGNYASGWEKHEWRSKTEKPSLPHANPICPRLDNDTLLDINKLLVISEQGFGDTLQFMRYVLTLKQRGIHTSLCAQPKLHKLIQASGIEASPLTPEQANQVTDGHWIPLLSLPKYLEVSPDNPIITEPYIQTTDELNSKWRTILSAEKRPVIGINWQGSPSHEVTTSKGRSLPLEAFAPIATQNNTSLLSLQKGFGSEQLDTCSFKEHFVSCQDQVNDTWDFLETASIIANCDLIITSDTAVAHLAGGMGKATWLLLKKVPEWRWGLEGDSTFWYPTIRLFRQNENGDWNEVMQQVTLALQKHFRSDSLHA
ncbi:hypothetical protein KR52_01005 [Synechococcus sp. KORDI-52]|nr:hypothetical protein KR52_01005 [Synechococcus sp. KORDI-52]